MSKGNTEPLQEVILGMKNSLLASISGIMPNKFNEKEYYAKKSQSPTRKDFVKSTSKNVKFY